MTRATLKGLAGRKLRTALTALSIVLGVAMVCGTYILTDTMTSAADTLAEESQEGIDAVVSARTAFDTDENESFSEPPPIPAELIEKVRAVPEVRTAVADVSDFGKLLDDKGETIGQEGAPPFAVGVDTGQPGFEELSSINLRAGRYPAGPDQIAIDAGTAEREKLGVGDRIGFTARGPAKQFEIAGIVRFGSVDSIGGATFAVFDLETGQALFDKRGVLDLITVAGDEGVSQAELIEAIGEVLPASAKVERPEDNDRFSLEGLKQFIDFIQTFLLAFGVIALFVGAFIIFNTLSITVAQRSREFALLRTVGASRQQILRTVILEALVVGVVASALGLAVGYGLAEALGALISAIGVDLPQAGTVFAARTVIVSMLLGVIVTLVAGLAPALRATRVPPVAALRQGAVIAEARRSRLTPYLAGVLLAASLLALAYGMFANDVDTTPRLLLIAAGCLLLFVAVALFSSRFVAPLAHALGAPAARIGGAAGRLARDNAVRNPGRTAATASALMIGLALVTFVAVLGDGLRSSYGEDLDEQLQADYALTSKSGFEPFAPEASRALVGAPEVQVASTTREDQAQVLGDEELVTSVQPATIGRVLRFRWKAGSSAAALGELERDGAVVQEKYAEEHDLRVGSPIELLAPTGRRLRLRVAGIDTPPEFNPLNLGSILISAAAFDATFATDNDRYTFLTTGGGATESNTKALEARLRPFPDASVNTKAELKEEVEADIAQLLGLIYVLLALSVIVSLFGIVNTLVLSVFERTREIGMLRAVGMTRRQVRRMVRHESVITALVGAALGAVLGVFLAALVTRALADEGIAFSVPIGTLVALAIVSVLAGILAAILPARRAARLDVLKALQYE